jgi:hypothetical protein
MCTASSCRALPFPSLAILRISSLSAAHSLGKSGHERCQWLHMQRRPSWPSPCPLEFQGHACAQKTRLQVQTRLNSAAGLSRVALTEIPCRTAHPSRGINQVLRCSGIAALLGPHSLPQYRSPQRHRPRYLQHSATSKDTVALGLQTLSSAFWGEQMHQTRARTPENDVEYLEVLRYLQLSL